MTAPKRDNRRFTAAGRFGRKGATYECRCCGRMTRETGLDESDLELCAYCLEESYLENALSDGNIESAQYDIDLDKLQKAYKRGKYAKSEADKKVRKVQSSRYVAPAEEVVIEHDFSRFQAAGDAVGKAIKSHKAKKQQAGFPVLGGEFKFMIKVGRGIVQVMELDDNSILTHWGLDIVSKTKETVTLAATRTDLNRFRNGCAERISSQYDQPLWYMSSAKATVAKIDAALKAGK